MNIDADGDDRYLRAAEKEADELASFYDPDEEENHSPWLTASEYPSERAAGGARNLRGHRPGRGTRDRRK